MAQVEVRLSGPLFDGRAERIVDAAVRDAADAVAQRAVNTIRTRVRAVAKQPSGKFASRVVTDRRSAGRVQVHAAGLRYTSWLEGTARRNRRSRFKGYRLFQQAREKVRGQVAEVAGPVVRRRIREING